MEPDRLNLIEALKDIVLPPVCYACGRPCIDPLCNDCRQSIDMIGKEICILCGKRSTGEKCAGCVNRSLHYYRARSFACYSGTMKTLIYRYKQQKMHSLAPLLADFLEICFNCHYSEEKIDLLDGMPDAHVKRLCGELESRIKIPYANNFMKIGRVSRQKFLGASDRSQNVLGAYKLKDCLKYEGRNILIIDDVLTTGSTLNNLAKLAKAAGAGKVYLMTLTRGAGI